MEKNDIKLITSEASKTALVFGLISGGYFFLEQWLSTLGMADNSSVTLINIVSSLLWLVKFVGLIFLMKFVMKRFKEAHPSIDRKGLIKYGTFIALFSSIITAVCSYVTLQYVFADAYNASIDMVLSTYESMMDAESFSIVELMMGSASLYVMIAQLIWCFLFGWVLSRIMASKVAAPKSVFDEDDDDDI